MKTARVPTLKFRDGPASYLNNRKRKPIDDLIKQGSTSKVNEKGFRKLPVLGDDSSCNDKDDVEVFLFDEDDDVGDLWELLLERDDGKPIDMDVVEKYLKQVEDSEGFDIIDFPGHIEGITNVIPRQALLDKRDILHDKFSRVMDCATLAITSYNKANQKDFKVLEIVKLNSSCCKAITYYMTFSAMDAKLGEHEIHGKNGARKIFQAKVVDDLVDKTREVVICRPVADK